MEVPRKGPMRRDIGNKQANHKFRTDHDIGNSKWESTETIGIIVLKWEI